MHLKNNPTLAKDSSLLEYCIENNLIKGTQILINVGMPCTLKCFEKAIALPTPTTLEIIRRMRQSTNFKDNPEKYKKSYILFS